MCEPLVSVIIPVYNGADYLQEAIESILAQTYSNIEVIVVNDGSTDRGLTEKIALSYGDKIRYTSKKNGGVATALNTGINQMSGEYFSWLSHDDIFYPDKVQKQVQLLKKEQADITACAYDIFYDSGRKVPVPFVDFYGHETIERSVFSVLHSLVQFGGVLFKKELFEKYGRFRADLKTTQDYEFLFRVLRKEKCIYSNERLYGIRYHDNQGSNTISCVNTERDEMYQMFIKKLSCNEKEILYGSVYNFYYQMLLRVWPIPEMYKSVKLCKEGLCKGGGQEYLADVDLPQPVLIYGAGMYGRRLLFDFRCRGIQVNGFIDGSPSLKGSKIDGATCYSLQDVKNGAINGTIIIASLFREEIAATLKASDRSSFYFREDYERKFLNTAPGWKKIREVIDDYDAWAEKKECRVVIYCMGEYGISTYLKLKEHGIKIDGFADCAPQKRGYALDGLYCKGYEELLDEDKECFLIVAKKNPEPLIAQFKQEGFRNVYDKENAIRRLVNGEKQATSHKEPLKDMKVAEEIKQSIQDIIYNGRKDIDPNLPNKNMLSDYLLRHSK